MFTEKKATAEFLLPFYCKLKKVWCRESCSPSLRENRPDGNGGKGAMLRDGRRCAGNL